MFCCDVKDIRDVLHRYTRNLIFLCAFDLEPRNNSLTKNYQMRNVKAKIVKQLETIWRCSLKLLAECSLEQLL